VSSALLRLRYKAGTIAASIIETGDDTASKWCGTGSFALSITCCLTNGGILHHRREVLVITRQLQVAEVLSKQPTRHDKSSFVKVSLGITKQLVITKQLKLLYTLTILQEYQLWIVAILLHPPPPSTPTPNSHGFRPHSDRNIFVIWLLKTTDANLMIFHFYFTNRGTGSGELQGNGHHLFVRCDFKI
jgi:hypothetical protein